MNSVTGATLVLLLLLLPGIAFRRFYYTGEFSRQYFSESFSQLVLRVVLLSAGAQAGGYVLAGAFGWELVVGAFGEFTAVLFGRALGQSGVDLSRFVGFQLGLTALAGAGGLVAHATVRRCGLDVRFKLFRFQNYWHYLLRGGIRGFDATGGLLGGVDGEIDYTYVDVLVSTSEGDMLYDGIVVDYQLSPHNQLDKLLLTGTRRRLLRSDRAGGSARDGSRYYPVEGDFVVIPAREIKNYNVRYVIGLTLDRDTVRVADADGDVTSAAYYQTPPT